MLLLCCCSGLVRAVPHHHCRKYLGCAMHIISDLAVSAREKEDEAFFAKHTPPAPATTTRCAVSDAAVAGRQNRPVAAVHSFASTYRNRSNKVQSQERKTTLTKTNHNQKERKGKEMKGAGRGR